MAVPVITFEGTGPSTTLKRSASLFKERWAGQVSGNVAIGGIVGLLGVLPALPDDRRRRLPLGQRRRHRRAAAGAFIALVGVILLVVSMLIIQAMRGVFGVALYRYRIRRRGDHGLHRGRLRVGGEDEGVAGAGAQLALSSRGSLVQIPSTPSAASRSIRSASSTVQAITCDADPVRALDQPPGDQRVVDPHRPDAELRRPPADEAGQPRAQARPSRRRTPAAATDCATSRGSPSAASSRGRAPARRRAGRRRSRSPSSRPSPARSARARASAATTSSSRPATLRSRSKRSRSSGGRARASRASASVSGSRRRASPQSWATSSGPVALGRAGRRAPPVLGVGEVGARAQDVELDRVDARLDRGARSSRACFRVRARRRPCVRSEARAGAYSRVSRAGRRPSGAGSRRARRARRRRPGRCRRRSPRPRRGSGAGSRRGRAPRVSEPAIAIATTTASPITVTAPQISALLSSSSQPRVCSSTGPTVLPAWPVKLGCADERRGSPPDRRRPADRGRRGRRAGDQGRGAVREPADRGGAGPGRGRAVLRRRRRGRLEDVLRPAHRRRARGAAGEHRPAAAGRRDPRVHEDPRRARRRCSPARSLTVRYVSVSGNRARVEARYRLAGSRPSRGRCCCWSRTASGGSATRASRSRTGRGRGRPGRARSPYRRPCSRFGSRPASRTLSQRCRRSA